MDGELWSKVLCVCGVRGADTAQPARGGREGSSACKHIVGTGTSVGRSVFGWVCVCLVGRGGRGVARRGSQHSRHKQLEEGVAWRGVAYLSEAALANNNLEVEMVLAKLRVIQGLLVVCKSRWVRAYGCSR